MTGRNEEYTVSGNNLVGKKNQYGRIISNELD